VSFGIQFPEVVALGIRISNMCATYAQDLLQNSSIRQCGRAQLCPIFSLAARYDVVDGSQGKFLMIKVAV